MERDVLVEENHQASNPDLVSKSVGSSVKIDSISIDLVRNDETNTGKCEHFSIRGFVSEVRKKNWKLSWPFALNGNHNKPDGEMRTLPPLPVPKFRWWRCQNCLQEMSSEAMLQLDSEQASKLNVTAGEKMGASIATFLNSDNCCLPSDDDNKGKTSEPKKTPAIVDEIFPEDKMNQAIPVSAGAVTVSPGLMTRRHHPIEIGKQPYSGEKNSILTTAGGTSRVVGMVDEVLDAAKGLSIEFPSLELDDCDNASSDSDETLSGNNLQYHHHENSSGSHHRRVRKVRLLTELLAENGDVKANLVRSEGSPSNSVLNSSAGINLLSDHQGPVAVQGNPIRLLDPNKKRNFPHDEEQGPLEISSPTNFHKKIQNCTESAETSGTLASSDAKEDAGIDLQIGVNGHLNKFGFDRSPLCKKKTKSLVIDEDLSLALCGRNIPEDIQRKTGDANNVSPSDAVLFKSAQTDFTSRGIYPFPLPPQKTHRNSSISKKRSKIHQFDECQASPIPRSGMLSDGPARRKDAAIKQMHSTISPFQSSPDATTGKELQLSLSSCLSTQGYDSKHISPVEHWQFPWQGCSAKENVLKGKDICTNYAGDSDYPSKSESEAFLRKGTHCDLSWENCRFPFMNEQQKSTSQVDAGDHSLMQTMDFCSRVNNGKFVETHEHSALAMKPCDLQADKVSEQGVPDDIPMEIVELMAKNQYERCLPDAVNERPLETTINTWNGSLSAKGKSSFLSDETARKPKPQAKNGRNGKITISENGGTSKQKSVDCFPHISREQFNLSPLKQTYGPAGFMPFAHCQEKSPNGIKFSDSNSSKLHSAQNCQWFGNILEHRTSQNNLQTLGACIPCQNVPQQGKETANPWSSMIPNNMAFIYDVPQKYASQSSNTDLLSHCPGLPKGNVNGNHNLSFLNVDVTNIEKHNRSFDSESLSRPRAEYPFVCKHSRTGPLDVYSNETIPAMHLLSLMDAGLQSGASMDIDGNRKFLKRPSFPRDRPSKDFSGLSSGGFKTTSTVKPSPCDYYGKNHLSENSGGCYPAVQTVGAPGFSFQYDRVVKQTTGFTGQASLNSQERDKSKASHSPSQIKDNRSQQPLFITGGSGTSHGTIPVHNMEKIFVGTSDSLAFPLTIHERENATKQKLESRNNTGTGLPPKSNSETETCSINRNPADFSMPEDKNMYMIRGEDLNYKKKVFYEKRSGLIKSDGRKRQKKLNAMKGNV